MIKASTIDKEWFFWCFSVSSKNDIHRYSLDVFSIKHGQCVKLVLFFFSNKPAKYSTYTLIWLDLLMLFVLQLCGTVQSECSQPEPLRPLTFLRDFSDITTCHNRTNMIKVNRHQCNLIERHLGLSKWCHSSSLLQVVGILPCQLIDINLQTMDLLKKCVITNSLARSFTVVCHAVVILLTQLC